MKVTKSHRARGGCRGGIGGGYERTDPDYLQKRLRQMCAEYNSLEPQWRKAYLDGLDRTDKWMLLRQLKGQE